MWRNHNDYVSILKLHCNNGINIQIFVINFLFDFILDSGITKRQNILGKSLVDSKKYQYHGWHEYFNPSLPSNCKMLYPPFMPSKVQNRYSHSLVDFIFFTSTIQNLSLTPMTANERDFMFLYLPRSLPTVYSAQCLGQRILFEVQIGPWRLF